VAGFSGISSPAIIRIPNRNTGSANPPADRNIHQPRIISFSAYVDEKDREDAFDAGMDGVIEKPVTIEQLRRFIEEPPGS
jgi:CheY-like chemotaxis protein